MSGYLVAKHVHQVTAVLLIAIFVVRGILMLRDSPLNRRLWVTLVSHVNDTLLLTAALYMAWLLRFPDWVIAKLVALVAFIGVGIVALKRGRTRGVRATAWVGGLALLAYLVSVALTKRVVPV